MPGSVMTRLGVDIGMRRACSLYKQLILATLDTLPTNIKTELWCYPSIKHPFFIECWRRYGITRHPQIYPDLGKNMMSAFKSARKKNRRLILIGTDMPEINANDIFQAIESMENGSDIVILPTCDGGYGLIAMKSLHPEVFKSIALSTDKVFTSTLRKANRLSLNVELLNMKNDIDTISDYRQRRAES